MKMTPEEILQDREALERDLKLGIALHRLKNLHKFKEIVKAYTETLPLQLIKERSLLVKEGLTADNLQQQIDASGLFLLFLDNVGTNYEIARDSLNTLDNEE